MNVIVSNKYQAMLSNLDIDVIKSINGVFSVEDLIVNFTNFYFNKMILDITAIDDYEEIANIQKLSLSLDVSKIILLLDDTPICSDSRYISKLISMGIYNFTRTLEGVTYLLNNPNSYKDVAHLQQLDPETPTVSTPVLSQDDYNARIIGIKNITEHAGATTFTYMLKKQLERNYRVLAIEIDKMDFKFFLDDQLTSATKGELKGVLDESNNYDVILLDLNGDEDAERVCGDDIICLIEPSTIKLNKMIRRDRHIIEKIKDKKIVLNQSILDENDIKEFEYEAKSKVFYNIPPLDDKKEKNIVLDNFLSKLGFIRQKED